ncbi:hydroxysteroid dehydrogenase, putative [Talaromyces stipitatus ATCC 10500]|uniref:Hydroxysteroid dehydrogenase, putative n=1 Tax=Talaromyces stipitatus (strain ATCC 10500 / CBS 375.48 / QM 6759 / NRRL 1006) TaxID=441959 RepID=B8M2E2_TALSN|nr:hydroxysteroid dehydrogenase, putative [Talaromyces stipitatus ATCC 10500]EED21606.1 hydroxysteroid dehydrogenase, putative [Talaromyces stipitatus ATCC 10500]
MGNGQNPYDFVYAGNLADAYLPAVHALLDAWGNPRPTDPTVRVDGEIFHITNDNPWFFWDFQRAVASETGNAVRPEEIVVILKWVGLMMGLVSEWTVWAISGITRTPNMTRESIRFSTLIRTLNISKAKRVLGYRPRKNDFQGWMRRELAIYT